MELAMDMVDQQEFGMSVGTLLTRLEDRIEKRFDRVEEKMSGYAQRADLTSLVHRNDLDALAERVKNIEDRGWDRDLVGMARNNWPWIVAVVLWVATNWSHLWHP